MAVLDYLPQFKRGVWLAFGALFCMIFFHKNVRYVILFQLTKFQCHTFCPFQDIKQNVLSSFYLDK